MSSIIAMLVFVKFMNAGGPLMIQGFATIEACEAAIPAVVQAYGDRSVFMGATARCVKLPMGEVR